ncbi:MAG: hypothetical protein IKN26_01375 [Eubacterium sp.]|nr:hypothetical protein [Eubacterium sp.]
MVFGISSFGSALFSKFKSSSTGVDLFASAFISGSLSVNANDFTSYGLKSQTMQPFSTLASPLSSSLAHISLALSIPVPSVKVKSFTSLFAPSLKRTTYSFSLL